MWGQGSNFNPSTAAEALHQTQEEHQRRWAFEQQVRAEAHWRQQQQAEQLTLQQQPQAQLMGGGIQQGMQPNFAPIAPTRPNEQPQHPRQSPISLTAEQGDMCAADQGGVGAESSSPGKVSRFKEPASHLINQYNAKMLALAVEKQYMSNQSIELKKVGLKLADLFPGTNAPHHSTLLARIAKVMGPTGYIDDDQNYRTAQATTGNQPTGYHADELQLAQQEFAAYQVRHQAGALKTAGERAKEKEEAHGKTTYENDFLGMTYDDFERQHPRGTGTHNNEINVDEDEQSEEYMMEVLAGGAVEGGGGGGGGGGGDGGGGGLRKRKSGKDKRARYSTQGDVVRNNPARHPPSMIGENGEDGFLKDLHKMALTQTADQAKAIGDGIARGFANLQLQAPGPPAAAAAAAAAPTPDAVTANPALVDFLSAQGFREYAGVLAGLGVDSAEDIMYVSQDQLTSAGIKLVHAIKIMKAAQKL